MISKEERANEYLLNAKELIYEAGTLLERGKDPMCVRRCQESVEFSIKAICLIVTGSLPKKWRTHSPIDELIKLIQETPSTDYSDWFKKEALPKMLIKIKTLAFWRDPSFYGDEDNKIPAEKLFGNWEATIARAWAQSVYSDCLDFVNAYIIDFSIK